ncbi:MAG: TSUP family transporter [Planctomycetota bacterium]
MTFVEAAQIVLPVLFVAALVQGATGFGFGLVGLGLLGALLAEFTDASVVLAVPCLTLTVAMLWRLRRQVELRRIAPLVVAAVVAIPAGVFALKAARPEALYLVLGLLLAAAVVQQAVPHLAAHRWHPLWLGVPCGVLSGLLGGAFNTGGPPVVAYVASQRFGRFRHVATLQLAFTVFNVTRIANLTGFGLVTWRLALYGLAAVPAVLLGMFLGLRVLRGMSDRALRIIVALALLLLSVRYLYLAFA